MSEYQVESEVLHFEVLSTRRNFSTLDRKNKKFDVTCASNIIILTKKKHCLFKARYSFVNQSFVNQSSTHVNIYR